MGQNYPSWWTTFRGLFHLPVLIRDVDVSGLIGLDDIVPGDFNGDGLVDILGFYSNNDGIEICAFYKKKPTDWSDIED